MKQENKMLTAKQAHEISVINNVDGIVSEILKGVLLAAERGETSMQYRGAGFGDSCVYGIEENYPQLNKSVLSKLRELGYSATVRSKEAQFVDLWLQVSW